MHLRRFCAFSAAASLRYWAESVPVRARRASVFGIAVLALITCSRLVVRWLPFLIFSPWEALKIL